MEKYEVFKGSWVDTEKYLNELTKSGQAFEIVAQQITNSGLLYTTIVFQEQPVDINDLLGELNDVLKMMFEEHQAMKTMILQMKKDISLLKGIIKDLKGQEVE